MRTSTLLLGIVVPSVVFALWKIEVTVATAALGAIGYACSSGAAPACAIAAAAAIIVTAMSGINNGQNSGTTGGSTAKRGLPAVTHYLPNGTVHDYLNTAALDVGTWHTVQTGEHIVRASKHPDGYNILRTSLTSGSKLSKRADPNAIEDISAQFGNRDWPVANQWGQDEVNDMASKVINTDNLNGVSLCSSISDDTDADTFDLSWIFETLNKPYTEIPPPCGA